MRAFLLPINRIRQVPAVKRVKIVVGEIAPVVKVRRWLKAPALSRIILRSRSAITGKLFVAVKIHLDFAFTPPSGVNTSDADDRPDKSAGRRPLGQQLKILLRRGRVLAPE